MTEVLPRAAPNFLGEEFNRFLFAPVGTDRSGGQLSVVSALARLDLDAWAEAAALTRLPRAAAVAKLAGMLRRVPEIPQMTQDSATVAARLIVLLPGGVPSLRLPDTETFKWPTGSTAAGVAVLLVLSLVLGMQYASHAANPPDAPSTATQLHTPPKP